MKEMILIGSAFTLIVIALVLSPTEAQENIDYNYTHSDGLEFRTNNNGVTHIYRNGRPLAHIGEAITGKIGNVSYIVTTENFTWSWSKLSYNYTEIVDYDENDDPVYENRTVNVFPAYNNKANFNWTKIWTFDSYKPGKLKHIITNDLGVTIKNTKFWYVYTMRNMDSIKFNGTVINDIHLKGNFSSIDRKVIDFSGFEFRFGDIISNGFDVTDVYIGNGSVVGHSGRRIIAIGVSKGDGEFNNGMTVEIDPFVTGYKSPASTGSPSNDWTDGNDIISSNNLRTHSTTLGDLLDTRTYDFGIPSGSTVHGIQVQVEGACNCVSCVVRSGCVVQVSLSWNGGTNYTDPRASGRITASTPVAIDSTKTIGRLDDDWGHTWIINDTLDELGSLFRARVNFSSETGGSDFADNWGLDHIQVNINYTPPLPFIREIPFTTQSGNISSNLIHSSVSNVTIAGCVYVFNDSITGGGPTRRVDKVTSNGTNCIAYLPVTNGTQNFFMSVSSTIDPLFSTGFSTNQLSYDLNSSNFDPPIAEIVTPLNGSNQTPATWINLNFTINDTDGVESNSGYLRTYTVKAADNMDFEDADDVSRAFQRPGTYSFNFSEDANGFNHTNLLAFHKLNNNSAIGENSTFTVDSANGTHNGTIIGATPSASGYFDGGFYFDGTNDFILIGNETNLSRLCINGCTLSAWIRMIDPTDTPFAFIARYGAGGNNQFVRLASPFSTELRMSISGDGTFGKLCEVISIGALTSGWIHIVGKYFAISNAIVIYKNGVALNSKNCDGDFSSINQNAWDDYEALIVGGMDYDPSAQTVIYDMYGYMDQVVIWNTSDVDVAAMFDLQVKKYYWNITVSESKLNETDNVSEEIIYPFENGTFEFTFAVTDTCTYDSGDWNVVCSDNCTIPSNTDVNGNNIKLDDTAGIFTVNANITNVNRIDVWTPCIININDPNRIQMI